MAGDWLKIEAATPEKREVMAITLQLGWDDPDLAVGKLFKMWRWFDQQTLEGNADSVTPALLDRIIGVTGFCAAVESVGWLVVNDDGISLPNFNRHNGETAKKRALGAKRTAKSKGKGIGNAKGNAISVTPASPREEKRREENKTDRQKESVSGFDPGKLSEFADLPEIDEELADKDCSNSKTVRLVNLWMTANPEYLKARNARGKDFGGAILAFRSAGREKCRLRAYVASCLNSGVSDEWVSRFESLYRKASRSP
jgi:hypothetical protein